MKVTKKQLEKQHRLQTQQPPVVNITTSTPTQEPRTIEEQFLDDFGKLVKKYDITFNKAYGPGVGFIGIGCLVLQSHRQYPSTLKWKDIIKTYYPSQV